jgi:hypothetical protein
MIVYCEGIDSRFADEYSNVEFVHSCGRIQGCPVFGGML